MSEESPTYAVSMQNGSGVERAVPRTPARTTRSLLPLSWFRREVEITLADGESFQGTLLDVCPVGALIRCKLSRTEATRRCVAWDHITFIDLKEDA